MTPSVVILAAKINLIHANNLRQTTSYQLETLISGLQENKFQTIVTKLYVRKQFIFLYISGRVMLL